MKILHVISSGGMYGAEAVILNLSRALNEGPHRSLLGVFSNSSNENLDLHQAALREGIESYPIPCRGQVDWRAIRRIRELAAQTGVEVVHAHGYKADLYVYFAMRSSRIPMVATCHNWIDNDRKAQLYGVLDRWILRRYAAVAAVSEDVRERLLRSGVAPAKIFQIRNGIDLRPFDGAPAALREELGVGAWPLVGLAGRLSLEKGVDVFLDAARCVLKQIPQAKFVVAGDGPERAELDRRIEALGLGGSARLLGRRTDMPSFYASLDVLVSSSRTEGLPIGILEGMASRLALAATRVGEIPNILENRRTGLLVPAENPELLAAAILELLQDGELRARLGAAARRVIEEEFSAQRMAAEYSHVYEGAISACGMGERREAEAAMAALGKTK